MVAVPVWALFGLVVVCAAMFQAVRIWLAAVAVLFGLYLADTGAGDQIRHGIDNIMHPAPAAPATPASTPAKR